MVCSCVCVLGTHFSNCYGKHLPGKHLPVYIYFENLNSQYEIEVQVVKLETEKLTFAQFVHVPIGSYW